MLDDRCNVRYKSIMSAALTDYASLMLLLETDFGGFVVLREFEKKMSVSSTLLKTWRLMIAASSRSET